MGDRNRPVRSRTDARTARRADSPQGRRARDDSPSYRGDQLPSARLADRSTSAEIAFRLASNSPAEENIRRARVMLGSARHPMSIDPARRHARTTLGSAMMGASPLAMSTWPSSPALRPPHDSATSGTAQGAPDVSPPSREPRSSAESSSKPGKARRRRLHDRAREGRRARARRARRTVGSPEPTVLTAHEERRATPTAAEHHENLVHAQQRSPRALHGRSQLAGLPLDLPQPPWSVWAPVKELGEEIWGWVRFSPA